MSVQQTEEVILQREVEAIQIPSGDTIVIPQGIKGFITQKLGNSYTIATDYGLARISEENKDALGLKEDAQDNKSKQKEIDVKDIEKLSEDEIKEAVWEQLKEVYDPEIPINIVDLGLVYDLSIDKNKKNTYDVIVKMTLTAPGCGMGPTIAADAQGRIMSLSFIRDANVELVWDPAWHQDMISEEGKMKLGMV